MPNEVRWERMFPDELEESFAKQPVAFFPYGLCEPHGPQNAVGCDGLRAHAICCAAARQYGGIVAPVFYWHLHDYGVYASWGHDDVGQVPHTWLTPLPPWMFFRNICYQLRAADVLGFQALILFSGHGGPHDQDTDQFVELVQPRVGARIEFIANDDDLDKDPDTDFEWVDHAGKGETSGLWATEPACTDISRLPSPGALGTHFAMGKNASESDRRRGQWLTEHKAAYLAEVAQDKIDEYQNVKPAHKLATFRDVEMLWEQVVLPVLPQFACMQEGKKQVPEDSMWHANWRVPHDVVS